MEPIGCPETSMIKYQSSSRNIPEDRRSKVHRGYKSVRQQEMKRLLVLELDGAGSAQMFRDRATRLLSRAAFKSQIM